MSNNVYALHDDGTLESLGTCRTSPRQKMRELVDSCFTQGTAEEIQYAKEISMSLLMAFYVWYENEQRLIEAKRMAGK